MTEREALQIVSYLAAGFPQKELTAETIAVYVEHLQELDYDAAHAAAYTLTNRSRYFPLIAEIREAVGLLTNNCPTQGEAWSQVLEAAVTRTRALMHPTVRRAFDLTINDTYEPNLTDRTRRFFLDTYREEVERLELVERRDDVARILGSDPQPLEAGSR